MKKNGSAIDATIAAMFCNGIVTMQSMGLGGGFLMTIYKRDEKKAYFLNAREKASLAAKDEIYKNAINASQHGKMIKNLVYTKVLNKPISLQNGCLFHKTSLIKKYKCIP